MFDWDDILCKVAVGSIGLACGFLVLVLIMQIQYEIKHPCIRYTKQMVHHNGWTQFIDTGKGGMVPIFHSPYDQMEDVCVARKE